MGTCEAVMTTITVITMGALTGFFTIYTIYAIHTLYATKTINTFQTLFTTVTMGATNTFCTRVYKEAIYAILYISRLYAIKRRRILATIQISFLIL